MDIVLDIIGGDYTRRNLDCLARDGRLAQVGVMGGAEASISLSLLKSTLVTGPLCPRRVRISRPVSPHVLRHTFAVTAVLKGVSLPTLQRLLGHDHLTTTEIYLNLSPEEAIKEFQSKW